MAVKAIAKPKIASNQAHNLYLQTKPVGIHLISIQFFFKQNLC